MAIVPGAPVDNTTLVCAHCGTPGGCLRLVALSDGAGQPAPTATTPAPDVPSEDAASEQENISRVLRDLRWLYLAGELDPYADFESWETVEDGLFRMAQQHDGVVDDWSAEDLAYAFGRKTGQPDTQGFHPRQDLPMLFANHVDEMRQTWAERSPGLVAGAACGRNERPA